MISLFVEQGAAMNRKISNFHIPPASMTVFDIISTSIFIICYGKLILPLYVKITKRKSNPPSKPQRMGIGLAIATAAIITAGVVEHHRLKYASEGQKETSSLSIFWQTPQYVLLWGATPAVLYVVMNITSKNGKPGWVPANLNDGHLDRFFFLCAALTALNLVLRSIRI
ncbi:hypothetical protein L1987_39341 [Smallanthus sonchifolius]|uniref:Uncharacterized protein n=1 Tax=Smallanthus sonchifolius TaxID=185202 RepID=A0ACB9HPA2_9ASTR|nr:hypothetical protein L1987_39341 [Smallanthus sonchifolius]